VKEKIKQSCIKFHAFDEFSMYELKKIDEAMEDLGYEGKFVYHGHLLPISKFNASIHQSQRGKSFWKSKDYCNNFIFTPMAQLPPKVNFTI